MSKEASQRSKRSFEYSTGERTEDAPLRTRPARVHIASGSRCRRCDRWRVDYRARASRLVLLLSLQIFFNHQHISTTTIMTTPVPIKNKMNNNTNNTMINLVGCNRCGQLGRWVRPLPVPILSHANFEQCVEMGHHPADPRCRQCRQANVQRCNGFRVKQSSSK